MLTNEHRHQVGDPFNLLLAESDQRISIKVEKILRGNSSCSVDIARSAEEAENLIQSKGPYQVALIDDLLPQSTGGESSLTGIELIRRIKVRFSRIEVIALVDSGEQRAVEALRVGAFHYLIKPFNSDELAILVSKAAEYQRLKVAARENQILQRLVETNSLLLGRSEQQEVLDRIVQAIQAIGFDRVRLYLISEDGRSLVGKSQVGMDQRFVGVSWPISDDCYAQILIDDPRPHIFRYESGKPAHSEVSLDKEGVKEWVEIPMVFRGKIIGVLSADNKSSARPIVEEGLAALALFASQAAGEIEPSELFAKAQTRARRLNAILQISSKINAAPDLDNILRAACQSAVELLEVDHSGIVIFNPDLESGKVRAEYPDLEPKGEKIQLRGVPAEERLIQIAQPLIIPDVSNELSLGPVRDILLKHDIRSAMFVPIVSKDRTLGSFSLDTIGRMRRFSEEDIELCEIFATQVAVAIENAQHTKAMEELHQISLDITRYQDIPQLMQSILDRAVALLQAKGGGIYLMDKSGTKFKLAAVNSLPYELTNEEWPVGNGVIGHVVTTMAPFSVSDYRNWVNRRPEFDEFGFTTVAGAPIAYQDLLWGVIAVHDDKPNRTFSSADLDLLSHVGNMSAVAYENARRADERNRLIASAFDAIIAVNEAGDIIEFNRRAEAILGWKAEEVLRTPVESLYFYPEEAHKIKHMLLLDFERGSGRVADHVTSVRSKDDEEIPIRISATLSFDHEGKISGSVGFFHDLRDERKAEQQIHKLRELLEAIKAINSNLELSSVLKAVVDLSRDLVGAKYGALAVPNAEGEIKTFVTSPELDAVTNLPSGDGLLGLLLQGPDPIRERDLSKHPSHMGFPSGHPQMTSFLGVPITSKNTSTDKIIGSLYMTDKLGVNEFSTDDQKTLEILAAQAAIAIENARLYYETNQRLMESQSLQRVCVTLTDTLELNAVLYEVVQAAMRLTDADEGSILLYDIRQEKFTSALTSAGCDQPLLPYDSHVIAGERRGVAWEIIKHNKPIFIADTLSYSNINPVVVEKGRRAVAGLPLRRGEEPIGVLYANWRTPRSFSEQDKSLLIALAAQAAVAIQNAKHHDETKKAKDAAGEVAESMVLGDLENTLRSITDKARTVVGCDAVVLYEFDQTRELLTFPPEFSGLPYEKGAWPYPQVEARSIAYKMLRQDELYIAHHVEGDPFFRTSPFARKEKVKSVAAIPLTVSRNKVGVMFVNYFSHHNFTSDEINDTKLFGHQAAVAISNAQQFEAIKRNKTYLSALHVAAKAITDSFKSGPKQVLDRIVQQAVTCIQSSHGSEQHLGTIELYDITSNELKLESVYPTGKLPRLVSRIGKKRSLTRTAGGENIGIAGRAVLTGKPQAITDAPSDPDYITYDPDTKSELAVPLLDEDVVLGVLNVESSRNAGFDKYDVEALEALAELAVIAIKNSQQLDELRKTKGLVGSRTALAWIGMVSASWLHRIAGYALAIRDTAAVLAEDLDHGSIINGKERLERIQTVASKILNKPITPPLSSDEGVTSILIDRLLNDRIRELWRNESYKPVELRMELHSGSKPTVRASLEWLWRAFDILVSNAVRAMANQRLRRLTVTTRYSDTSVEIAIADTGSGISEETQARLFREPVPKPREARGLGIGLLIAQAIVETYGGELFLSSTGPSGTSFVIRLPLES